MLFINKVKILLIINIKESQTIDRNIFHLADMINFYKINGVGVA
jgi:hypothetical protein